MTDLPFDTLEFVGRRVPDYSWEVDASGAKFQEELPGTYEVGLLHQGVFRPIASFPAAGFLADVKRAQMAADAAAPPPEAPATDSTAPPPVTQA
jgi:hypothetical protein